MSRISDLGVLYSLLMLGCGSDGNGVIQQPDAGVGPHTVQLVNLAVEQYRSNVSDAYAIRDPHAVLTTMACPGGSTELRRGVSSAVVGREGGNWMAGQLELNQECNSASGAYLTQGTHEGALLPADQFVSRGSFGELTGCRFDDSVYAYTADNDTSVRLRLLRTGIIDVPDPACPVITENIGISTDVGVSSGPDEIAIDDHVREPARLAFSGGDSLVAWLVRTSVGDVRLAAAKTTKATDPKLPYTPIVTLFPDTVSLPFADDTVFDITALTARRVLLAHVGSGSQQGEWRIELQEVDLPSMTFGEPMLLTSLTGAKAPQLSFVRGASMPSLYYLDPSTHEHWIARLDDDSHQVGTLSLGTRSSAGTGQDSPLEIHGGYVFMQRNADRNLELAFVKGGDEPLVVLPVALDPELRWDLRSFTVDNQGTFSILGWPAVPDPMEKPLFWASFQLSQT